MSELKHQKPTTVRQTNFDFSLAPPSLKVVKFFLSQRSDTLCILFIFHFRNTSFDIFEKFLSLKNCSKKCRLSDDWRPENNLRKNTLH